MNLDQLGNKAAYVERLINALDGNPQKWEYRGECGEDNSGTAKCACGHPIKYLFPVYCIENGQEKMKILGSSCVDHYSVINPQDAERMKEAYSKLLEKKKAEIAEAKRIRESEEVKKLEEQYTEIHNRLFDKADALTKERKCPYDAFLFFFTNAYPKFRCLPEYKHPKRYIKWYSNAINFLMKKESEWKLS